MKSLAPREVLLCASDVIVRCYVDGQIPRKTWDCYGEQYVAPVQAKSENRTSR